MSQSTDIVLSDQAGASFRSELNSIIGALATSNSGGTAPGSTYAFQWWINTGTNELYIRNAANTNWILMGNVSQALGGLVDQVGLRNQTYTAITTSTTSPNVYTGTLSGYTLTTNSRIRVKFAQANTSSATLNIGGLGAKTLKKQIPSGNVALQSGDIVVNSEFDIEYDGTDYIILNAVGAQLNQNQTFTVAQRGTVVSQAYSATTTLNLNTANYFSTTLTGNLVLANPTNVNPGQSGSIWLKQDATGNRTISFGSNWKFTSGVIPTLSVAANALDRLDYVVLSSTEIHAALAGDIK